MNETNIWTKKHRNKTKQMNENSESHMDEKKMHEKNRWMKKNAQKTNERKKKESEN